MQHAVRRQRNLSLTLLTKLSILLGLLRSLPGIWLVLALTRLAYFSIDSSANILQQVFYILTGRHPTWLLRAALGLRNSVSCAGYGEFRSEL